MNASEAVHRDPVWRDRSNFIIAIAIDPGDTDVSVEQLWSRKLDDRHYEICCIPFFAYDLALGDVVEVDADYMVQRVSDSSGRYVFRVHFEGTSDAIRAMTVDALQGLGAQVEWSSTNLLGVDAVDRAHAQDVAGYLHEQESARRLIYETGKITRAS